MNTTKPHVTVMRTSDWHLGRFLFGRKRKGLFEAFLQWLLNAIRNTETDVLLVAGDIFDITTPGNRAQEQQQYYCCSPICQIGISGPDCTGRHLGGPWVVV